MDPVPFLAESRITSASRLFGRAITAMVFLYMVVVYLLQLYVTIIKPMVSLMLSIGYGVGLIIFDNVSV